MRSYLYCSLTMCIINIYSYCYYIYIQMTHQAKSETGTHAARISKYTRSCTREVIVLNELTWALQTYTYILYGVFGMPVVVDIIIILMIWTLCVYKSVFFFYLWRCNRHTKFTKAQNFQCHIALMWLCSILV